MPEAHQSKYKIKCDWLYEMIFDFVWSGFIEKKYESICRVRPIEVRWPNSSISMCLLVKCVTILLIYEIQFENYDLIKLSFLFDWKYNGKLGNILLWPLIFLIRLFPFHFLFAHLSKTINLNVNLHSLCWIDID